MVCLGGSLTDFVDPTYRVKADAGEEYQLEKAMKSNELRALLTMEAGVHPVPLQLKNHKWQTHRKKDGWQSRNLCFGAEFFVSF